MLKKIDFPSFKPDSAYITISDTWSMAYVPSLVRLGRFRLFHGVWWHEGKFSTAGFTYKGFADHVIPRVQNKPVITIPLEGRNWYSVKCRASDNSPFNEKSLPPSVVFDGEKYHFDFPALSGLIKLTAGQKKDVYIVGKVVYFIQGETNPLIKIGIASDLNSRLSGIQTGNPDRLKVLATIPGGKEEEKIIHNKFSHLRIRGEWYKPEPDLLSYIHSLKEPNQ